MYYIFLHRCIFTYCYHLVNVIRLARSQSEHNMQLTLKPICKRDRVRKVGQRCVKKEREIEIERKKDRGVGREREIERKMKIKRKTESSIKCKKDIKGERESVRHTKCKK
jgi:hypothetical protein